MDPALETLVWKRAGSCCEYCQMPHGLTVLPFQIDHVIAEQHGGRAIPENLALSCMICNVHKGPNIASIDPQTSALVPLFHPRRDTWADHFAWSGPHLVGLTAVGRATIAVLAINMKARVALRASLIQEGVFPPAQKAPDQPCEAAGAMLTLAAS
jgi:hypothetical protein